MGESQIIGVRFSLEFAERLKKMAKERSIGGNKVTVSDLVRDIVINNLDFSYNFSQWEIEAWNLFNVNAHNIKFALHNSTTAEQFFSILTRWSKDTKIRVIPSPDMTMIEFTHKDRNYVLTQPRHIAKLQAIAEIVDELARQITVSALEGVENAQTSLCNGTIGGGDSPGDEES